MPSVFENFEQLLKEEKYGEIILYSWAYVEYVVNLLFLEEFGLSTKSKDKKAEFLMEKLEFEEKWKYLKNAGLFTDKEKEQITRFQNQRNELFHVTLFSSPKFHDPKERKELTELAKNAFYIVVNAYVRKHKLTL